MGNFQAVLKMYMYGLLSQLFLNLDAKYPFLSLLTRSLNLWVGGGEQKRASPGITFYLFAFKTINTAAAVMALFLLVARDGQRIH